MAFPSFGNWATLSGGGDSSAGLGSSFPQLGDYFSNSVGGGNTYSLPSVGGYTDVAGNNAAAFPSTGAWDLFGSSGSGGSGSMGGQTGGSDGWGGSGPAGGGGGGGGDMSGETGGDDGWGNFLGSGSFSGSVDPSITPGLGTLYPGAFGGSGGSAAGGGGLGSMMGGMGGGGFDMSSLMNMFGGAGGLSSLMGGMMGGGGGSSQPAQQTASGPDPYQQAYNNLAAQINAQQAAATTAANTPQLQVQFAGGYTKDQLQKLNDAHNLSQEAALKARFDEQNAPEAKKAVQAARTADQVQADNKADAVKSSQKQAAANGGAYDTEGNYYSNTAAIQKAADDYNATQKAAKDAAQKTQDMANGITSGSGSEDASGSGSGSGYGQSQKQKQGSGGGWGDAINSFLGGMKGFGF